MHQVPHIADNWQPLRQCFLRGYWPLLFLQGRSPRFNFIHMAFSSAVSLGMGFIQHFQRASLCITDIPGCPIEFVECQNQ